MRLIIDTLVAGMLAAVLAGVVVHNRQQDDEQIALEETRSAIHQIQQQVALQITLEQVELTDAGFPRTIDPLWFKIELPRNSLLLDNRPWLEIAGPEQMNLKHPTEWVARSPELASFWYNPYQGVIRARVPVSISDAAALRLYNAANGVSFDGNL